jgi:hypothetical protein
LLYRGTPGSGNRVGGFIFCGENSALARRLADSNGILLRRDTRKTAARRDFLILLRLY